MKINRHNSGFVLVASIMLTLFLSILLVAAFIRAQSQLQAIQERMASTQALYAAESGIQNLVFQYRENPVGVTQLQDGVVGKGSYHLEIQPTSNYESFPSVWVKSTGSFPDPNNNSVQRSILAQIVYVNPQTFFVSTAGDLHIGSGSNIQSDILANNVYLDTNPALPASPPQIIINGNVLYLSSINGLANNPAVQITGDAVQFPNVTSAGVDVATYQTVAQDGGYYQAGDAHFTGSLSKQSLGTTNGLVFVDGDIYIQGQIQDPLLFVATGNIYIQDSVTTQGAAAEVGLMADKDVFITADAPANLTIDAYVVAGGAPGSQGGIFQAEGSAGSKQGTINFNGSISVQGNNVTGASNFSAVDLNVYQNRIYTYQNNASIPFITYMANIISWTEVRPDPQDPIPVLAN